MESVKPYYDYASFLKERFPFKVQKITLNAGFSCPNRDGRLGWGGCAYCNNKAFSPAYTLKSCSVGQQMREGISFFVHKYPDMKYLAYFQSYTNTYEEIDFLIKLYEEALAVEGVVGLVIGTRPDCIFEDLLDYFQSLSRRIFVMIEYGIESTINNTLRRINRGHTFEQSKQAIIKTAERGIPVGGHLILGLPGETREDFIHHALELNKLPLSAIKLHQLQIIKHTVFAKQYELEPEKFHLFSIEEYMDVVIDFVRNTLPQTAFDRFVSQAPEELLLAPRWGIKNYVFTSKLEKKMNIRGVYQGDVFEL